MTGGAQDGGRAGEDRLAFAAESGEQLIGRPAAADLGVHGKPYGHKIRVKKPKLK